MLEFFGDDGHWLKGGYDDRGGPRCLVGAAIYFSAMHGIYYGPVLSLLLAALPGRQMGLPFFNDHRCGSVAELRSVIEKARAFALKQKHFGGSTTRQKSPKNFRAPPAENRGPILPQKKFRGANREGATPSPKKLRRQKARRRAERQRRPGRRFSLIGAGNST